jgi:hypothetical protein
MNLKTNRMGRRGLKSSGSGQGQVADSCGHGNEILDSIKCEKFLEQLAKLSASQQGLGSMESVSLVGWSVGRSVGRSVGWLVCLASWLANWIVRNY